MRRGPGTVKRQEMPPQGGVVKRNMARTVLVTLGMGIAFLVMSTFLPERTIGTHRVMDTAYRVKEGLESFGLSSCVFGVVWWARFLRCPCCGLSFAMPWWSGAERHFCSHCGKEIVFDDTPPSR